MTSQLNRINRLADLPTLMMTCRSKIKVTSTGKPSPALAEGFARLLVEAMRKPGLRVVASPTNKETGIIADEAYNNHQKGERQCLS